MLAKKTITKRLATKNTTVARLQKELQDVKKKWRDAIKAASKAKKQFSTTLAEEKNKFKKMIAEFKKSATPKTKAKKKAPSKKKSISKTVTNSLKKTKRKLPLKKTP